MAAKIMIGVVCFIAGGCFGAMLFSLCAASAQHRDDEAQIKYQKEMKK